MGINPSRPHGGVNKLSKKNIVQVVYFSRANEKSDRQALRMLSRKAAANIRAKYDAEQDIRFWKKEPKHIKRKGKETPWRKEQTYQNDIVFNDWSRDEQKRIGVKREVNKIADRKIIVIDLSRDSIKRKNKIAYNSNRECHWSIEKIGRTKTILWRRISWA